MKVFLEVSINKTVIYLKVDDSLIHTIFDTFIDAGYKVVKGTPKEWDYNIETGNSYELDTQKELDEFIKLNNKAKEIREYETQY